MRYVLVFPRKMDARGRLRGKSTVMLIRKAKPDWQRGKLNLVGGKVEPGESSLNAARREFREETGIKAFDFNWMGMLESEDWAVSVFDCAVGHYDNPKPDAGEQAAWYNWHDVKDDPSLIENLRAIIPMLITRTGGWEFYYSGDSLLPTVGNLVHVNA